MVVLSWKIIYSEGLQESISEPTGNEGRNR